MDGLIAQLLSTLQVFVDDAPDSRCSFRELDEMRHLAQFTLQIVQDLLTLRGFTTPVAAFDSNQ